MFDPGSTYRIQFHKGFTFRQLEAIVPYLAELGIKTVYASPIFKAVPGSMHGYDVTDPLAINPEIGTLAELRSLNKTLNRLGISWLQDIVPNHMAYHPDNHWLMDVLQKGPRSMFAGYFDILWDSPVHNGRLMVPFLGKPWQEAVDAGEVIVRWTGTKLVFDYFGQLYPLNIAAYRMLIAGAKKPDDDLLQKIDWIMSLGNPAEFSAECDLFLTNAIRKLAVIFNDRYIKKINKEIAALDAIAGVQYYRLCFWQETDTIINYRRFFTVNGLICLSMQDKTVFDHYHGFIKHLLDEGLIQGLRVDHIDGLYDPATYLQRLRKLAGPRCYIVVEKILEKGDVFPSDWPVQGNTGYDMLATLNNLFTQRSTRNTLSVFYKQFDHDSKPLTEQIWIKKRLILERSMQGELENLYREALEILPSAGGKQLKAAIGEFLVHCPVYRYYGNGLPLTKSECDHVKIILAEVIKERPGLEDAARALEGIILSEENKATRGKRLHFYMRLMQFAGPLMAKGVEDTLMYTFNRFVDHNEVGDSPASTGLTTDQFHEIMTDRQKHWPLSMTATSTHDTKRGEDARARLNVLSDLASEWVTLVNSWREINVAVGNGIRANDEYFIYQH